jgi:hypothetical protein
VISNWPIVRPAKAEVRCLHAMQYVVMRVIRLRMKSMRYGTAGENTAQFYVL